MQLIKAEAARLLAEKVMGWGDISRLDALRLAGYLLKQQRQSVLMRSPPVYEAEEPVIRVRYNRWMI